MDQPNDTDTINEQKSPGDGPNIEALQEEYDNAWAQDELADRRLNFVENLRYLRWAGQSPDGLKHRDIWDAAGLEMRWPDYEGGPDTRIPLADDIIGSLVPLLCLAFWNSRVKVSPTTGRKMDLAQAAELRAIISWLIHGPLADCLIDDVELTAQIMTMLGWCVLHPTWATEKQLRKQKITMEQLVAMARQAAANTPPAPPQEPGAGPAAAAQPDGLIAQLPAMVSDPNQEKAAVEIFLAFFADFDRKEARAVIKELRETGEAEFEIEQQTSVGPEVQVLCPWYHFIMPVESAANPKYSRAMFVRMKLPRYKIDELAEAEGWDPEFTEMLKKTAGMSQRAGTTLEDESDLNMKLCEFAYAFCRRTRKGAVGIFCTVMSPNVRPGPGEGPAYGADWLLDLAHKKYPFVFQQMEVTGWQTSGTRGVPDMVITEQAEMKQQRDAAFINSQLSNTPPMMRLGTSTSKLPPEISPGAILNAPSGKPWEVLNLTSASNPELAIKLTEMVRKEGEDRFGIERGDTLPQRYQRKQQWMITRWLMKWAQVLWQLSMLAYQNMEEEELEAILGRKPLLTAEIISRHTLALWYDPRAGDGEWMDRLMGQIEKIMQADTGGTIDHNKLVSLWLSYLDPTLAEEVTMDEAGAKEKVFKDTRDEINSMALGNKPMLTEKDPTARMKMAYAKQVVGSNPEMAARLNPQHPQHDPNFLENFETYMKNLQHSYQETTLSKIQGRMGVADVGQQGT